MLTAIRQGRRDGSGRRQLPGSAGCAGKGRADLRRAASRPERVARLPAQVRRRPRERRHQAGRARTPERCFDYPHHYPPEFRAALDAKIANPIQYQTLASFLENADNAGALVVNPDRNYGSMPLIVLTGIRPNEFPRHYRRTTGAAGRDRRSNGTGVTMRMAALSTRGVNTRVPGAGHYIRAGQAAGRDRRGRGGRRRGAGGRRARRARRTPWPSARRYRRARTARRFRDRAAGRPARPNASVISSRLLTRGKGPSGTGTPRNAHSGSQPCLGENTSSRSGGSASITAWFRALEPVGHVTRGRRCRRRNGRRSRPASCRRPASP